VTANFFIGRHEREEEQTETKTNKKMKKMKHLLKLSLWALLLCCAVACSNDDEPIPSPYATPNHALFVVNGGIWNSGNASLSIYNPAMKSVTNDLFYKANGYKLGDTAQSMTIYGNTGWIVVNNSHIIYAVDLATMKEKGRITGINSPRWICFASETKAYISHMYSNEITIINPKTYTITGKITCPNMDAASGSTEQMLIHDGYLYVSCWSYQKDILKIDTATDKIVKTLEVGIQPASLVMDRNNKLWTHCDGGWEGNPLGYEAPKLCRINPVTMTIEKEFTFAKGDYFSKIYINGAKDTLYWTKGGVYAMSIEAETLPTTHLIDNNGAYLYSMTIDPLTNDIYTADAIDYQQAGKLYRYSASGTPLDSFYVGIIPENYCWNY
jgi:hypothetical protein